MTTGTENSTTPMNLTQELQNMAILVNAIIQLLQEKGLVTAEEIAEAAKEAAEEDSNAP